MRVTRRIEEDNTKSSNEKRIVDLVENEIDLKFLLGMVIWYTL